MLDEFGAFRAGDDQARRRFRYGRFRARNRVASPVIPSAGQRPVDLAHDLRRPLAFDSNHDAVGIEKICNRGPFAQKFRIRSHIEQRRVGPVPHNDGANPVAGIHRNRAFFDHHLVLVDAAGDFPRHGLHIRQIGVAAFGRRCSDGDEYYLTRARGRLQVAGKVDALAAMPRQQLRQESFMNRHLAVPERGDFLLVVIDQDNLVPQIRKTRSGYQAHVPRTDHRDAHSEPSLLEFSFAPPARRRAHITVAVFPALTASLTSAPRAPRPGMGIRISQQTVTAITAPRFTTFQDGRPGRVPCQLPIPPHHSSAAFLRSN